MSTTTRGIPLEYAVLDVFAERAFEGNPLAVFADARGLSTGQMQALARETNLSETTFILPGDAETEQREGVRVRIFTTAEELPFAGHPTLGTASWLRLNRPELAGAEQVRLRLGVGPVEVRFAAGAPGDGLVATMRQADATFGREHDARTVSSLLGLPPEALDPRFPAQTVSTGLPFCLVPVVDVEALRRLQTRRDEAEAYLRGTDAKFFYCVAPEADGWRARMQFYSGEDPATGSAAGCAAAWLVRYGRVPGGVRTVIRQGVEVGRPSHLTVEAREVSGNVTDVFVSGRTIPVASGHFLRPV